MNLKEEYQECCQRISILNDAIKKNPDDKLIKAQLKEERLKRKNLRIKCDLAGVSMKGCKYE